MTYSELVSCMAEEHAELFGQDVQIISKDGTSVLKNAIVHAEKTRRSPSEQGLRLVTTRRVFLSHAECPKKPLTNSIVVVQGMRYSIEAISATASRYCLHLVRTDVAELAGRKIRRD
jgi:hypothetical protein